MLEVCIDRGRSRRHPPNGVSAKRRRSAVPPPSPRASPPPARPAPRSKRNGTACGTGSSRCPGNAAVGGIDHVAQRQAVADGEDQSPRAARAAPTSAPANAPRRIGTRLAPARARCVRARASRPRRGTRPAGHPRTSRSRSRRGSGSTTRARPAPRARASSVSGVRRKPRADAEVDRLRLERRTERDGLLGALRREAGAGRDAVDGVCRVGLGVRVARQDQRL